MTDDVVFFKIFIVFISLQRSHRVTLVGGDLSTLKVRSVEDIGSLYQKLSKEGPSNWLDGYQDKARTLGLNIESLSMSLSAENIG